jgi:hypothetical protein
VTGLHPPGTVAGVLYQEPATRELVVRVARPRGLAAYDLLQLIDNGDGLAERWTTVAEDEQPPPDAALRIPDDVARALLDALQIHYGGESTARASRADLLAERARVDKMTDALITIATRGPAGPATG